MHSTGKWYSLIVTWLMLVTCTILGYWIYNTIMLWRWKTLLFKLKLKSFNVKHFRSSFFKASIGISSIPDALPIFTWLNTLFISNNDILFSKPVPIDSCCSTNSSTFSIDVGVGFNRSSKLPYYFSMTTLGSFDTIPSFTTLLNFLSSSRTLPCMCYTFVVVLHVHFSSTIFL